MTLQHLSATAFVLGLGALAAVLFLLQRLRVRHEEVPVVTTLFWRQAVEEARARVLTQRFRHPWAYALVVAIAALLWLAIAGPRAKAAPDRDHLLLLDGSAGMAREGRLAAAIDALEADLEELSADARAVVWCGATPRTLLLPGEEVLLLEARLEGLAAEAAPATIEAELLRAAAADRERPLAARVYGDAPVRAEVLAALPGDVSVSRAAFEVEGSAENRGLVALGSAPASSGVWSRVDVLVEVAGGGADDLRASLDGSPLESSLVRVEETPGGARVLLADLPAEGGRLGVSLPQGDALALDDLGALRLPRRPPIRVALSASAAPALEPVLSLDPAVVIVAPGAPADVACRAAGETAGGDAPALELVPAAAQADAFLVTWPGDEEAREGLVRAVDALALEEVDATALAAEAGRPISVGVEPGTARRVRVWSELLTPSYDLLESRAFPLFVASSVRWLAGEDETPAWVAAGEPVRGHKTARSPRGDGEMGSLQDPAGADFVPSHATGWRRSQLIPHSERPVTHELHASLLDPAATAGPVALAAGPLPPAQLAGAEGDDADLVTWVLLFALGLLCAEWWLHRTGRMP
jgi:hypothetical protein